MIGNTDNPVKNRAGDALGVQKYIDGLSGFIKICDTPMTMAIQGGWGSGKTSFMNMIREEIKDNEETVWFNTWQFSQFNMGNQLPLTLLMALADSLNGGDGQGKEIYKKLKTILLSLTSQMSAHAIGVDLSKAIEDGVASANMVEAITELKNNFQKCVDSTLSKKKKEKLVVFIDDLDRLPPARAVEVLEILKLFLDCEHCVFVLAIDYDVVCYGIKEKYGKDLDFKKGRSFFDKIIQVPFKMPIANYEVEQYIRIALTNMDFSADNAKIYVDLISKSMGYNPRGIKRILNAFQLLKMIYAEVDLKEAASQSLLFAVLCLQMAYEEIYNNIVQDEDERINAELFSSIAGLEGSDPTLAEEFFETIKNLKLEDDMEDIKDFMVVFCTALENNNGTITDVEVDRLHDILKISGTTASTVNTRIFGNGKSGRGTRYDMKFDESYADYPLDAAIEKSNAPTGWNNSKIKSYQLFGERTETSNFAELVVNVLSVLNQKNPAKFQKIRENSEQYKLYGLFYGSKKQKTLVAPKRIPGTTWEIETKNSYDGKIKFLRNMMDAMGYDQSTLILRLMLASRVE